MAMAIKSKSSDYIAVFSSGVAKNSFQLKLSKQLFTGDVKQGLNTLIHTGS
tara:strand:- start:890 stop:1042 length:153 start_codon:yes stop_codon:yes gene_type:complete